MKNSFWEINIVDQVRYWTSAEGRQSLLNAVPSVLLVAVGLVAAQVTWQMTMVFSPQQGVASELYKPPPYEEQLLPASFWKWSKWNDLYAKPPVKETPKISLKVEVLGIIGYGESGSAMLKVGNKKSTSLYFVGDTLGKGVRLSKVSINSVTLKKGRLTKEVALKTKASDLFLKAAPLPKASQSSASNQKDKKDDIVVSAKKLRPEVRSQLDTIGQQAQKDPTSLAKDFSADAVNRGGSVIGYRLRYNLNPALLLALGLRPTDILLEVNGVSAAKIGGDPSAIASLMGLAQYNVLIERNGRQQNLVIRP